MSQFEVAQATIQRVTTIDTKGGGFAILLTTTNNIADDVLTRLMRGRGSVMKLTFEDTQLSLLPGEENDGLPPSVQRAFETTSGDVVNAHPFECTTGSGACDLCGWAEQNEAHSAELVAKAQQVSRLIDDARAEAAEQSITQEQAEARTALASRSRNGRGRGGD